QTCALPISVLECLGNPAGSYADGALNRRRLLKIRMVRVKYQGVLIRKCIAENLLMQVVPDFAFLRQRLYKAVVLHVVIEIKMRRLVHFEVQLLITHLVLPEILGLSTKTDAHQTKNQSKIFQALQPGGICKSVFHISFLSFISQQALLTKTHTVGN